MVIGVCTLELSLPAATSLKDKRQVIKSLMARLRNEFNISVAEVGAQDQKQWAVVGVACVSSDRDYAHGLLSHVVNWVQHNRLDCDLADYQVQIM
ncbi:MAG: DUF503 domain-containing protein [Ardenticatenia bacterium]|jgi:uncharacterized protein YlxP (DUF503 family)|nr:MAG: DUF503 domain-containing protein [Ardenticatenia bacterium]